MEYLNKKIWEEEPSTADDYRSRYVEGIERYFQRKNVLSKHARRDFMPPQELVKNPEYYRKKYCDMLGLDLFSDDSSKSVEMSYVGSDDICEIYRLVVYITDEIPFYSMLLIPHNVNSPMPLVIAQHGGGGTPELCCDMHGKNNYNHMVQRALAKGAAILAPQLLLWSKTEIETMRAHPVEYDRGQTDHQLKRFGSSVTGLEISGIKKSLDYVCTLDQIDESKIAMIGISYGGYFTLHTMAADTRIKAGYAAAFFNDRDIYGWGNWTYKNSANMFQDAEVAALCAPRKLYVLVGKQDQVFDYRSAIPEAERVEEYFTVFGKPENFLFRVWEGGHTIADDDEGFDFLFSELNV